MVCTCSWSSLECETLWLFAQPSPAVPSGQPSMARAAPLDFPFGGKIFYYKGPIPGRSKRAAEYGPGRPAGISIEGEHFLIERHLLRRGGVNNVALSVLKA